MKILVTGSHGFVGKHLCEELALRGCNVFEIDTAHDPRERGISVSTGTPLAAYMRCDVGEYRQLARVFEKMGPFDYVYHLAAEFGRWNGEDFYEQLWQTNAVGTKNVIRLQEEHRFRLVHFSSSEVYGDWPRLMAEDVIDQYATKPLNDYAMSKWVNEMQIRNSIIQNKTESVIVRLFNLYGPGEHFSPYRSVHIRFLHNALKGLPWVVYKGYSRSSTYVTDAVKTLANIADGFKSGEVYNISGGQEHSIEELSHLVLKVSKASPDLVEYRETDLLTAQKKHVDNSKSKRDLRHQDIVSLEDGLARTFEWLKSVYS